VEQADDAGDEAEEEDAEYPLAGPAHVHPMQPKLKPPGTQRLKLKCHKHLSTSAFKSNLRR